MNAFQSNKNIDPRIGLYAVILLPSVESGIFYYLRIIRGRKIRREFFRLMRFVESFAYFLSFTCALCRRKG